MRTGPARRGLLQTAAEAASGNTERFLLPACYAETLARSARRAGRALTLRRITVVFGPDEPVDTLRDASTGRADEERIAARRIAARRAGWRRPEC